MDEFGVWLSQELDKRNLSMRQFGHRCGVTHATISRIINGIRKPSNELYLTMADVLQVPPDRVFREAGLLPPIIIGDECEQMKHDFDEY